MEDWRTVPTIDVDLEVSNTGLVRRPGFIATGFRRNKPLRQIRPPTYLSPWKSRAGYLVVAAQTGKNRKKFSVHRLVALAFVPGYADGLTVNHIDGNKLNNLPENLEWITLSENTIHQWKTGLVDLRGEAHPSHKLSANQVMAIRAAIKMGVTCNSLAVIADVSPALIYLIRDGRRWNSIVGDAAA